MYIRVLVLYQLSLNQKNINIILFKRTINENHQAPALNNYFFNWLISSP